MAWRIYYRLNNEQRTCDERNKSKAEETSDMLEMMGAKIDKLEDIGVRVVGNINKPIYESGK